MQTIGSFGTYYRHISVSPPLDLQTVESQRIILERFKRPW